MRNHVRQITWLLLAVAAAFWAGNTNLWITNRDTHRTQFLAHRGVHQTYTGTDRSATSCHASPVAPITHGFIENTLPSMQEAFRLGATVVELDVHRTPDRAFAVFHDWTLDCRTNGSGTTHDQSLIYLKTLDLAHNIDDGTQRYALRGTAIGILPSLSEVLEARLPGRYLINFKSRRVSDGTAFAELIDRLGHHDQIFGVYGDPGPTRAAQAAFPDLRGLDRPALKSCLIRYAALGWSGHVPALCRNALVMVPQNFAPFLWGWPHRFTTRLKAHGSTVILAGPYDGSGFSTGIDTKSAMASVPHAFDGFIWTNRIEIIAPMQN